jgi:hypothetical protein
VLAVRLPFNTHGSTPCCLGPERNIHLTMEKNLIQKPTFR